MSATFPLTVDETIPDGATESCRLLDNRIRETKQQMDALLGFAGAGTSYGIQQAIGPAFWLTNQTGVSLNNGDVVALDTANNQAVALSDVQGSLRPFVVYVGSAALANLSAGVFAPAAGLLTVTSTGTIARGQYIRKSATARAVEDAGVAQSATATPPSGTLGVAVQAAAGGTVVAVLFPQLTLGLPILTNGQLIIGSSAAAPVAAALTGTANQITVTNGAGSITLATPQNLHTAATPTFASLTLTAASSLTLGTVGPAGNTGAIILRNSANANLLTLQAGATGGALTFTLPTADGTSGQVIQTNGAGVLSFVSVSTTLLQSSTVRTTADFTTTSTTFVDVTSQTITFTTGARKVLLLYNGGNVDNSAAGNQNFFDFVVDAALTGGSQGIWAYKDVSVANDTVCPTMHYLTNALTAASHTFKVDARVSAGTLTLSASVCTEIFSAVELYA